MLLTFKTLSKHIFVCVLGPYQCIYPRTDGDGAIIPQNQLDLLLAYTQNGLVYVATRENKDIYRYKTNMTTKFSFGNFSTNFRSLLVDGCVCSHTQAYDFHGSGISTFTMLIIAMRHNNGLRNHTIHGGNFSSSPWYPNFMDIPEVKYSDL